MRKHESLKLVFMVLIIFTTVVYLGCEKKTGKTEETNENVKTEEVATDSASNVTEPVEETKIAIPDLTGKWTGTFDKKTAVLTITKQSDSSFTGKITINYREVINQDVKGIYSPTTQKISMIDQLHSRYQGKYNGKLSEDGKNYSGTFTMKLDGSKFLFNMNKK